MSYRFLILSSLLCLGACSYALDKNIQDVTILTPGAHNSLCYLHINELKYRFRPPHTMSVHKSKGDLIVDCLAPGNRRQKLIIEPTIAEHFPYNAANLGAGAVLDYATASMFKYPEVIEVDFTYAQLKPESLPAQNNPDIKQPEEYDLEEFSPGQPRLNSDRYRFVPALRKRQKPLPGVDPYTGAVREDPVLSESALPDPTPPSNAMGEAESAPQQPAGESSEAAMSTEGPSNEATASPAPTPAPAPAESVAVPVNEAPASEQAAPAPSEAAPAQAPPPSTAPTHIIPAHPVPAPSPGTGDPAADLRKMLNSLTGAIDPSGEPNTPQGSEPSDSGE